jgi:hypothetical protein
MFVTQRADESAAVVSRDGVIVEDRYHGVETHPSLDAEIRCRTSAAALLHKLGVKLPEAEPRPLRSGGKPGHVRSRNVRPCHEAPSPRRSTRHRRRRA